jgi:beta-mannanase
MLRFAAEMNGDWLPWSEGVNGNRAGDYVAVWRHVRARFRHAGADNAIWVWNPIATYEGSTPLRGLFPGERGGRLGRNRRVQLGRPSAVGLAEL